jgi:pimeloyl-ACP methyl ester carboxylesterase
VEARIDVRTRHRWRVASLIATAALIFGATTVAAPATAQAQDERLPIVFVHGNSGSAQQYETQAMRFTSNGYPQQLLYAFEYDTSVPHGQNGQLVDAQLDAFIDAVLDETGATQVHTAGHSRGTSVMVDYLDDVHDTGVERGAKVASYVNIDGRSPAHEPGGVPTLGIWGEWNSGGAYARPPGRVAQIGPDPDANHYFPDKGHTEVASSAEAFALMYRFFTGSDPATTEVLPEPPGQVTLTGRATFFPQNTGYDGATLEVWAVDEATGQRIGRQPRYRTVLGEDGAFGPVRVNGLKAYELALHRPDGSVHHYYQPPFPRSTHFLRLQSSLPGAGIEGFIPRSEDNTSLTVARQREWWGDQGGNNDLLTIDGLNVLTPTISPRAATNLAVFAFDHGLDQTTDLDKGVLPPFNLLSFLTAADVYIPADPQGRDTVEVAMQARGSDRVVTVAVPNRPSSDHRVTVSFPDHVQDTDAFPGSRGSRR